jgi:hypothetical protein
LQVKIKKQLGSLLFYPASAQEMFLFILFLLLTEDGREFCERFSKPWKSPIWTIMEKFKPPRPGFWNILVFYVTFASRGRREHISKFIRQLFSSEFEGRPTPNFANPSPLIFQLVQHQRKWEF